MRASAELADLATLAAGSWAGEVRDLAVVRIAGAERASFAHAQFTADCHALAPGASVLTAWCSPQGRVLFVLRLIASADALYALLPRTEAAAFVKRLRMYVLRAAVMIDDLETSHHVFVSCGAAATALRARAVAHGQTSTLAWTVHENCLPALDVPAVGANALALVSIRAGLPTIAGMLAGEFLPQELNLDAIGGVSFDKGCYPGQEIVARVRFRGRVKRRLMRFIAQGDRLPPAGTRVRNASDAEVGSVISSAWSGPHSVELLAVREQDGAAQTRVEGVDLAPAALPYPLVD